MSFVLAAGLILEPVLAVQNVEQQPEHTAQPVVELFAQFDGPVTALVQTADGNGWIVASQNRLIVIPNPSGPGSGLVESQNAHREVVFPSHQLTSLAWSNSGAIVWLGGGDPGLVGHRYGLPANDISPADPVEFHDDVLTALAVSPDGKWLAASSVDGRGSVSPTAGGEPVWLEGHSLPLTDICWLDDKTILTTSEDSSLRVWTFSGHQPGLPNRPIGEDRNQTGVDDVQGPPASEVRLVRTLHQHVGPVLGVCVLDGVESAQPLAASWGQDRTVRIWQPLTGRMVRFIRLAATPRCIAWNAETQQLVAGDQAGQLHWLDWKTGSILRSIGVDDDWLTVVLFDREGQRILVGTSGGNLQFVFSAN